MRKKVGIIKRMLCICLVFLLSIDSFAAIVSDNDGAAFITKAEFDALKNDFQSQIDSYNTSIDNKIDGAIASYLAGIKLATEVPVTLYPYNTTLWFSNSKVNDNSDYYIGWPSINVWDGIVTESSYGSMTGTGIYKISRTGSKYSALLVEQSNKYAASGNKKINEDAEFNIDYNGASWTTGLTSGWSTNIGSVWAGEASNKVTLTNSENSYIRGWGIGWDGTNRSWTVYFKPQFLGRQLKVTKIRDRGWIGLNNGDYLRVPVVQKDACTPTWGLGTCSYNSTTQPTWPTGWTSSFTYGKARDGTILKNGSVQLPTEDKTAWRVKLCLSEWFSDSKVGEYYINNFNNFDDLYNIVPNNKKAVINDDKVIKISAGLPLYTIDPHSRFKCKVECTSTSTDNQLWVRKEPWDGTTELKSVACLDDVVGLTKSTECTNAYVLKNGDNIISWTNNSDDKVTLWIKWSEGDVADPKGGAAVKCTDGTSTKLEN